MSRSSKHKVQCLLVAPGPEIVSVRLPERNGVIRDDEDDGQLARIAAPTHYTAFRAALFGEHRIRKVGRFQIFNRDLDEPLHLEDGPKRNVHGNRWAGQNKYPAMLRYHYEQQELQDEDARPLRGRNERIVSVMWLAVVVGLVVAAIKIIVYLAKGQSLG